MTALLALASAVLIGGSDFLGGVTSRRFSVVRVAALAQLTSFALAAPVAAIVGATRVTWIDAGWSVGSGVAVGAGLALFYTAMKLGLISLVAPVTAVTGISVPVTYALVRGERPGAAALAGIALAVPAIAIVSLAPTHAHVDAARLPAVIGLAVAAGGLFGLFFLFLSRTSSDAGLWPLWLSRAGSAGMLLVLALSVREAGAARPPVRLVAAIGSLEMLGGVTLLLAIQRGPLAIASVLASLYPVTTILLAAGILHERLTPVQLSGVALALVSVVLVSTG